MDIEEEMKRPRTTTPSCTLTVPDLKEAKVNVLGDYPACNDLGILCGQSARFYISIPMDQPWHHSLVLTRYRFCLKLTRKAVGHCCQESLIMVNTEQGASTTAGRFRFSVGLPGLAWLAPKTPDSISNTAGRLPLLMQHAISTKGLEG